MRGMTEGTFVNVHREDGTGPHACPCCGCLTLDGRGNYQICPVCRWEDDGQDADEVRGGPNRGISLTGAREHFTQSGVADERARDRARPPRDDEQPPRS
jgi:hypothetical protein